MSKINSLTLIVLVISLIDGLAQPPTQALVGNRTKIGDFIIEPTTLRCAGFEWKIYGDENRNASVTVHYRKKGSTEWKEALP